MLNTCVWIILLVGLAFADNVQDLPASTIVNCQTPTPYEYGLYKNAGGTLSGNFEGYTGALELIKVPLGENIALESTSCPACLSFLELRHTPGEGLAIVNFKKPLDIEAILQCNGFFSYSIVCLESGVRNLRTLSVNTKNGNSPASAENVCRTDISEALIAGRLLANEGPYFEHTIYTAAISENKVGPLENISPAPIKAHAGNGTIIYSISSVLPENQKNVSINNITGIITVLNGLDHEEISSLTLDIQASLENSSQMPANATVIIQVGDVNEPPVFSEKSYATEIYGVVPPAYVVVQVKAADPDVGQTLHYSMTSSSQYKIVPSKGEVVVMSPLSNGTETLTVRATDQEQLYDTATVKVTVVINMEQFVQISINRPFDIVWSRVLDTARALQIGIGLKVTIMKLGSLKDGNTEVTFIATYDNGTMVTPEEIKTRLKNHQDKVRNELQEVLGPDTDFEIIDSESSGWSTQKIGAVISGAVVGCLIVGLIGEKRSKEQSGRRMSDVSLDEPCKFKSDQDSAQKERRSKEQSGRRISDVSFDEPRKFKSDQDSAQKRMSDGSFDEPRKFKSDQDSAQKY